MQLLLDVWFHLLYAENYKGYQNLCYICSNEKTIQILKENSDNYIKNLLNKMDYVINDKPKRKAEPKEIKKKEEEKPSIGNRLKDVIK